MIKEYFVVFKDPGEMSVYVSCCSVLGVPNCITHRVSAKERPNGILFGGMENKV